FDNSILLNLQAPGGRELLELGLGPAESVPFSFLTEETGVFELKVSNGDDRESHKAGYHLELQEVRQSNIRDPVRVRIERQLLKADHLASSWSRTSMEEALGILQESLEEARSMNEVWLEVRISRSLGILHRRLGANEEAVECLTEAVDLAASAGHFIEQVWLLGHLARIYGDLGEIEKGRELANTCLSISERTQDDLARAVCNEAMAYVVSLIEPRDAVGFAKKALELWRSLADRRGESRVLTELGHNYSAISEEYLARESFTAGLNLEEILGNPEQLARALQGLAAHLSKLDEKDEALALFYRAREISSNIYAPRLSAAVLNGLGMLFLDGQEEEAAIEYFREALKAYSQVGDVQSQGSTLELNGWAQIRASQFQAAVDSFAQSLPFFQQLGDLRNQAIVLHFMGEAQFELGQVENAENSLNRALEVLEETGDHYSQFLALLALGVIHQQSDAYEIALEYLSKALQLCQASGYRQYEGQAQYRLATTLARLGRVEEALDHGRAALEIAETVRADLPGDFRTSYLASIHHFYNAYADLLIEGHMRNPKAGLDVQAFQVSERARARSLLDTLGREDVVVNRGVDTALLYQETDLRTRLNHLAEDRLGIPVDAPNEAEKIDDESARLSAEYTHLEALIRTRYPRYASLTSPAILGLDEVQEQLLDHETLLLEYQLGEVHSYLWQVSRNHHQLHLLPARKEIETLVMNLLESLKARETRPGETVRERRLRIREANRIYWQDAQELSEILLGKVVSRSIYKRLLIVSDGALHLLPFSALPIPGRRADDSPAPLILDHELVRIPSASILAALRTQPSNRSPSRKVLAVLADPVLQPDDPRLPGQFGRETPNGTARGGDRETDHGPDLGKFPRLPASSFEAEAIVRLLPEGSFLKATGFESSRAVATSEGLRDFKIIHFATHGILNQQHPGLSGVVLSMFAPDGTPVEGFLRLHDIYNLDLPAEMVVLSACESYLGKEYRGEGLVGLVQGFMYAGAKRIVASLWKVDDLATKELMVEFYRAMFAGKESPAAALRSAQMKMWESAEWDSPFYWASFIIQGDWVDGGILQ
ncbi:MAG: CHAT domain-containing protein, partial [Acidobacteriota bacterium]